MLSSADRLAIQQMYARYCAYLDTGDWRAWSHCFTEDAVFATYQEVCGRAAIAEYGRMRCEERPQKPYANGQHWNSNLIIEGDGDTVHALCYLFTLGLEKATGEHRINVQGTYQDELLKIAGRWMFKRRHVYFDLPPPGVIPKE